jgi:hypothetical protein
MSHHGAAQSESPGKLVIRNIGLLLGGDLDHPILDADTVVAMDGVIRAVLDSIQKGDLPSVGMVIIDGAVSIQRSRNTPPGTRAPEMMKP